MRKLIFSALMLCGAMLAHAQLLDVVGTQRVTLPDGYRVDQANLSPDGSYAVISDMTRGGLTKLGFATGSVTRLTTSGSNYDLRFSADSRNIIYRDAAVGKDNLRKVAVKSTDVATKKTITIINPSRDIQAVDVNGSEVRAIERGQLKTKALDGKSITTHRPVLSIDKAQLCITKDGVTKVLSPLGTTGKSYIWQSLSPDGSKILFYVVGDGCYISDLDGSNIKNLGILRAPVWYDDNTVVGMVNESDGYVITASKLVASNIDGTVKQALTSPDVIATYPSATSGKISFSTPTGDFYIITLK